MPKLLLLLGLVRDGWWSLQTLLVYLSDVKPSVLNGVSTPPAPKHITEEAQEECEGQRKAGSVVDHCLLSMTLTLLS